KDAVIGYFSGFVLAYDERAFPKGGPQTWADYWDVKKFPGTRGAYSTLSRYTLASAVVAAGYAHKDVFPMTDDKLARAFAKLDELKPHITKWWTAGGEAPQLLINRELAMSSTWDARAIVAINRGAPLKFSWDGAYLNTYYW